MTKKIENVQLGIHRVGFIGLGVMGGAMCRNIIRRGEFESVEFYDFSPEAIATVAAVGGTAADSAMTVVQNADVIVLSLPDGDTSTDVVTRIIPHARAGQLIIDTSTIPVRVARELFKMCADVGVSYLDAPVARTREAAEAGTLSVMVGGDSGAFELARPLLNCIASEITLCGASGSGQVVKILNNMVLFQTVNALSEALAIGERAGVDGRLLFEVFSKGSADSFALRNHGFKSLLPHQFPIRAFSTTYARKDNRCALELADQVGIKADGAELLESIFAKATDQGLQEQYFPVFHKLHV